MFFKSNNGNIVMNRGDTFTFPVYVNLGTTLCPEYYNLKKYTDSEGRVLEEDELYFALLEPQQKWENATVKKILTLDDFDPAYGAIVVHFYTEDTEYLKPGTYFYEIKLRRCPQSTDDGYEHVNTIISRTKFIILE